MYLTKFNIGHGMGVYFYLKNILRGNFYLRTVCENMEQFLS